jgi:hypothetical protein
VRISPSYDPFLPTVSETVLESVERFLEARELEGDERVLAAVARSLARQLDAAVKAGTSRGMSAAPPLARRLCDTLSVFAERDRAKAEREAAEAERRARIERGQRTGRWAAVQNGR